MVDKKLERFLSFCEEGTVALGPFKTTKSRIAVMCRNGHSRDIMPDKLFSRGDKKFCTQCDTYVHGLSNTTENFSKQCDSKGLVLIDTYIDSSTRVKVRNKKCDHEYYITPNSLLTKGCGIICRVCNVVNKEEKYIEYLKSVNLLPLEKYTNSSTRLLVRNSICGHEYYVEPSSVLHKGCGPVCRICTPVNVKPIQEVHTELDKLNLDLVGEYECSKEYITVKNRACGHVYKGIATNIFSKGQGKICRVCYPNVSAQEKELLEFIRSIYSGWIVENDRCILGGKELDIVMPDLGLAVEYNGTYFHSTAIEKMDAAYHINKLKEVTSFGYRLISISENEWVYMKEVVKSRLRSILGYTYKIGARNTKVLGICFPREFLSINHIQGAGANCSINYGLFLQEELVAVMTFSRPRFSKSYDYELVRYCSLLDVSVVGGPSKLLKQFKLDHPNTSVVSYSDKRWSTGNLYIQLGFSLSHTSKPNYNYYKYKYAYSRYQCQKHLLKDLLPEFYKEELSESEIMGRAGFHKVYDCGNDVWVLK